MEFNGQKLMISYVASAAVTGSTTKTMTFTQRDGGTFTAGWTDNDSGGTVTSIAATGPFYICRWGNNLLAGTHWYNYSKHGSDYSMVL